MKIHFIIEYHTNWGEDIRLYLTKKQANGKQSAPQLCPLDTTDGRIWETEVTFQHTNLEGVEYKYAMFRNDELVWTEWEVMPHVIQFDDNTTSYLVNDLWRPIPDNLHLYSSAYTETVGNNETTEIIPDTKHKNRLGSLQLRIVEPRLKRGEHLGICGSSLQFGEWRTAQRMQLIGLHEYAINLDASMLYDQVEYKYVILDDKGEIIRWEDRHNRKLRSPMLRNGQTWIKTDTEAALGRQNWKAAGVVIPIFSLRTNKSYGVGDFGDLKEMVKWAAKVKMHVIQILPINDTQMDGTYMDSYPYNAISIFALHPLYCNLAALPRLNDRLQMEKFMMKQQSLNLLPQVDYVEVIKLKMDYLRLAYKQEGKSVFETEAYKTFFAENKDWLIPYAAFSTLRDLNHTADFTEWKEYNVYDEKQIEKYSADNAEAVSLYYYIQYQLHLQLLEARNAARANGIILKGDIPIGISRQSVEAWTSPHLFNMDGQAGAPPDDFSVNGQNWGFPTYNWEAMARDNYSWWKRRFKKMAEYFDAYRIDHVLGFFRIWEIPMHSVHGLLGQFSPSLPMSVNEIESYGLHFRLEYFTRPYITDEIIEKIFGYKKELITLLYLQPRTDGRYDLKPEFATQRLIKAYFDKQGKTDEDTIAVRDGLYALASNVLFVPDHKDKNLYHPRISAQKDFLYQSLPWYDKEAFDRLYNDYYFRRHNDFWYREAMQKLPALTQSTRMLVCAEDLGMVPDCVPWLMNNLKIISLEIQTMPKAVGMEFGRLEDNPYRSVATIATHDMSPLRMWWDEDHDRAQRFYNQALHNDGPAPHPAPAWLCEDIIARHLFSPSVLCLLSWQDWMSMDERLRLPDANAERINIPSNPRHYWRYRMHKTIEQLLVSKDLNTHITEMIENSGRA